MHYKRLQSLIPNHMQQEHSESAREQRIALYKRVNSNNSTSVMVVSVHWGVGVGGRWVYVWRVVGWGWVDPDCGRLWSPMLPHLVSRTETTGPGRCGSSSLADREFEAPLLRYFIVFFLHLMEMTVATPTGLGRTGCYSLRHHIPSAPVSTGDDLFTSPVCVR